ncbi:MAG: tRNA uridine-5-carboxymethylaminomethyl(34) synthesis enzyme MnmG [Dehalococcoidia bacterium]|nr:tRNA uridine-5-carboxymethylaminomethyl(34) synthesis enzyme MnmG [Dehalococcoidia bacterium]
MNSKEQADLFEVTVIGAGHAGCEAALASARMGRKTLLLTMNLDTIALMPCNPSVGGPAKGHVVREVDALGGEMARVTDKTFIQIRMLNTGKGPAVQVPRAQSDKKLYMMAMKHTLERQENLQLKQAMIENLTLSDPEPETGERHYVIPTATGRVFKSKTVVLTTGTSLAGRIIIGSMTRSGGRTGEQAAHGLSECLRKFGHDIQRLKTGTPPRVDARTIDFSKTEIQPGNDTPLHFSFVPLSADECYIHPANPVFPLGEQSAWRKQLPCYLVHTNAETHKIILANLERAPMFNGTINAKGPRYCPSIEDKIYRFSDKPSHGLFLEPEGWETNEVYVQGANTSLPEDVQVEMLRTIPALANSEIMRLGYAIEYDFVPPSQTKSSLESKLAPGLFFAGQINGTSGYEEAAGQGIMAGINAALKSSGKEPLVLRRDQAYIGVMLDDLVTRELEEPYRLMTSRAEYRLLLRQDNADLRLSPIGYSLGLISRDRYIQVENKRDRIAEELKRLEHTQATPNERTTKTLAELNAMPLTTNVSALEFLRRQGNTYETLAAVGLGDATLGGELREQVEIEAQYTGYIAKQQSEVHRVKRVEENSIPDDFDYRAVNGFRKEAREKLSRFRPGTIGQASRISGVNPTDVSILMIAVEKHLRSDKAEAAASAS